MFFVIEHNIRPDGVVNVSEVGRTSYELALSHFFERASKAATNANFVSSHLMLVEENLDVIRIEHIKGLYVAPKPVDPEPEPEPEPTPTPTPEPEPEVEETPSEEE